MLNPLALFSRFKFIAFPLLLTAFATSGCAHEEKISPQAVTPAPRTAEYSWMSVSDWNQKFAEDLAIARQGNIDLLLVGDSITQGWPQAQQEKFFKDYRTANFAIGGDLTNNLLWRLEHGEIEKLKPKAVVLLIGINNLASAQHTPEEVFLGVEANVNKLRSAFPQAKILVNAIFPYKEKAQDPMRATIIKTNKLIQKLDDGKQVFFFDYGPLLLQADGSISPEIMADFLHLTPAGYEIWGEAMAPSLQEWLK